jgi:hypothetical protein
MSLKGLAAAWVAALACVGGCQELGSPRAAEEELSQRGMAEERRRCAELEALLVRIKAGAKWRMLSSALADVREEVWACRGKPENVRAKDL